MVRARGLTTDHMFAQISATGTPAQIALDPTKGPLTAAAVAAGMRHAVAFPILRGNAALGVVVLAARDCDVVLDAAVRGLFDSIGCLLGLFVERIGAETALRELNVELEHRVLERTRALETGNRDDRLDLRLLPLGTCQADPSLLRTVWTNLIDNALKYARDRERIVIEIGSELRGDEVVCYVRDNGVGFDMAHAGRLFGVFQRLHAGSEFEGTGIGLAIVRRIVEQHHGRVTASSELGKGSKFERSPAPTW